MTPKEKLIRFMKLRSQVYSRYVSSHKYFTEVDAAGLRYISDTKAEEIHKIIKENIKKIEKNIDVLSTNICPFCILHGFKATMNNKIYGMDCDSCLYGCLHGRCCRDINDDFRKIKQNITTNEQNMTSVLVESSEWSEILALFNLKEATIDDAIEWLLKLSVGIEIENSDRNILFKWLVKVFPSFGEEILRIYKKYKKDFEK